MKLSEVKPTSRRIGATVFLDDDDDAAAGYVVDAAGSSVCVLTADLQLVDVPAHALDVLELHAIHENPQLRACIRRDAHDDLDGDGRCTRCGVSPGFEPPGLLRPTSPA